MASPQTKNGYIRIANEIVDEVIRRDFSKRQKDILMFIWRLSYGCNKKSATIPKLKDFTLCGVTKQNVKTELEQLETCNVIFWDKDTNIFTFNKNHDQWIITPKKGWVREEFSQLIKLNIQEKFLKQEPVEDKKVLKIRTNSMRYSSYFKNLMRKSSQNKNREVLKIRTYEFLKQELLNGSIPCLSKAKWSSKDMFKDIVKDIVVSNNNNGTLDIQGNNNPLTKNEDSAIPKSMGMNLPNGHQDEIDVIAEHYMAKRGFIDRPATQKDYKAIKDLLVEKIPLDDIIAGIDEAFQTFKPDYPGDTIGSFNYCKKVIFKRYYRIKGVSNYQPKKHNSYQYGNGKKDIVPDWYKKQKEERAMEQKKTLTIEEQQRKAEEADKLLEEYLANTE